jgi:hypothetical protein
MSGLQNSGHTRIDGFKMSRCYKFLLSRIALNYNAFVIILIIGVSELCGGEPMDVIDPFKKERSYVVNEIPCYKESEWIHAPTLVNFGGIIFETGFWHTMILRQEAIPKDDSPNTTIAFRSGNEAIEQVDLIRFKFKYKSMNLTLYESGPMVYVMVEKFSDIVNKENDLKKKIMVISTILFNLEKHLEFKAISQEGNYTLLSTNPECTFVRIDDWSDRIDCSANDNRIIFIMFKMSNCRSRVVIKSPYNWFPPEMRNYKP